MTREIIDMKENLEELKILKSRFTSHLESLDEFKSRLTYALNETCSNIEQIERNIGHEQTNNCLF
jgi:hypothetical protein